MHQLLAQVFLLSMQLNDFFHNVTRISSKDSLCEDPPHWDHIPGKLDAYIICASPILGKRGFQQSSAPLLPILKSFICHFIPITRGLGSKNSLSLLRISCEFMNFVSIANPFMCILSVLI